MADDNENRGRLSYDDFREVRVYGADGKVTAVGHVASFDLRIREVDRFRNSQMADGTPIAGGAELTVTANVLILSESQDLKRALDEANACQTAVELAEKLISLRNSNVGSKATLRELRAFLTKSR